MLIKQNACHYQNKYIFALYYFQMLFMMLLQIPAGDRCGQDCMVVGFITTYAISAYHH